MLDVGTISLAWSVTIFSMKFHTSYTHTLFYKLLGDFPGGPVVKNMPFDAEDMGWIPGQGTKILGATKPQP